MPETLEFTVEETDSGERLDRFLSRQLEEWSRSALQRWIEQGAVVVDGKVRKAGYRLKPTEQIQVVPPEAPPLELVPQDIPLQIVFEDDDLVIIDKPAGLVVHPGAGCPDGTLANALVFRFQQMSELHSLRPGIVHRLDKDTSGLLVVAKNESAHHRIAQQFKSRVVDKTYLALVYGNLSENRGVIDAPIGRHPQVRTRMTVDPVRGRPSRTEFRLVKAFPGFSYLEVKLHTGRTHQIRVHLQNLGHPVVGDMLYGGKRFEQILDTTIRKAVRELSRHFLHAAGLSFRHPSSGQEMSFSSPLPRELADLLCRLE